MQVDLDLLDRARQKEVDRAERETARARAAWGRAEVATREQAAAYPECRRRAELLADAEIFHARAVGAL